MPESNGDKNHDITKRESFVNVTQFTSKPKTSKVGLFRLFTFSKISSFLTCTQVMMTVLQVKLKNIVRFTILIGQFSRFISHPSFLDGSQYDFVQD